MRTFSRTLPAGLAAWAASLPALAHVTTSGTPHVHAGDGWGVLVVAVLTAVAACLGRHGR